ncbi:hypothetical protein V6N13_066685 [Hibiscus sabdariffa]|uniref:Uncharacterized protein n=1 Tax=Hibiscus sabdariffa TaxID=183260 RepID=A0ABR2DR63_9ROSI
MPYGLSVNAMVASKVRDFSTSVETGVKDKNFERIYIQNSISVGEEIHTDEDENSRKNIREGLEEGTNGVSIDSDMEKEAWNLLRDAVVMYCGYPVGLVQWLQTAFELPSCFHS